MRATSRSIARLLLVLALLSLATSGCSRIRTYFGIAEEISGPDPDTPAWIVQQLLRAGMVPEAEASWKSFLKILHSQEHSTGSLTLCKRTYWPAFRRKVHYLVKDARSVTYDLMEDRAGETEGFRKIFVHNRASEQATPVAVKRDPLHGGSWRIASCSL